tara:strand:- start:363 stop:497 length:135 start_codon:yes stop_codon:yes gene_type:complete
MARVIAPTSFILAIVPWIKNEMGTVADAGLLNGPDMADRKYIPL